VPDIIQLLPDHLANQIAAGEVIQRPASAVKELLENAVDAGATEIKLIVADAGKALVQVIDNGKGMSITDARMAFERHATSKISSIEDLFHIRTMGFRGEALASIAAVAQVELKTRRAEDELGVLIEIENSAVQRQEPISHAVGTSIAMKNVFFNVPARRSFLKSNTTELRNIIDEFIRVAMAFPAIHFSLTSNGQQVFFLEKGSLKQRIIQLLGNQYNTKLVPITEETDYLTIQGFVGKPDTARKTRGDQYFFVNNRFIRSAYLNHAVTNAYENLIAKDSYPSYVLSIQLDPSEIDINVHPTKQEIKFTDEKIAYAFVQAAVKHALAQFSIAPSLDFSLNAGIQQLDAVTKPFTGEKQKEVVSSNLYQTFTQKHQAHRIEPTHGGGLQPWKESRLQNVEIREAVARQTVDSRQMTDDRNTDTAGLSPAMGIDNGRLTTDDRNADVAGLSSVNTHLSSTPWQSELAKLKENFFEASPKTAYAGLEHELRPASKESRFQWLADSPLMQLHGTYIVAVSNQGYLLIHQQSAHERVLYDQLSKAMHGKAMSTQQSLFPTSFQLSGADAVMLQELLPDLQQLGYHIEPVAQNTFEIQGTPADVEVGNEQKLIEKMIEKLKHFSDEVKFSKREKLVRTLAWQQAVKPGRQLTDREMRVLVEQLFLCQIPNATPSGNPTYVTYPLSQLERMFGKV
jgi:DNA mismatch repair protein MutL